MKLKQAGRRGTTALTAAVLVAASLLSGCNKQRANLATDKAEAQTKQAREYKAAEFVESKDALIAAETALKNSKAAMGGQNYKDALAQAQDSVKRSKEALESAKARYSDQQMTLAEKALKVAAINDGQNENSTLYAAAEKDLAASREANTKQSYEDSIAASINVIKQVDQLLARLKNASENRFKELQAKRTELAEVKASEFLPNALIKADNATSTIQQKIYEDRDYKDAIIVAGAAISDAEASIIETKNRRSKNEIQNLEDKLAEAIAEEAPIHVPEDLKSVQESFAQILSSYYEKQYDTVLLASERLKPKVDNLITMARIEATRDKINTVEKGIVYLGEQDVERYLPGLVKAMEDLRDQAQDQFNNNNYEGAKFQAGNALIEQERIMNRFDALAEKTIFDASGAVAVAQKTFDRHNEIFGPGSKVVDERLEGDRKIEAGSLESRLAKASQTLQTSTANRTEKQFKKAIEQAKDADATADAVTNGVYKVVAQHTLVGIQDMISKLEREGARTQAAREMATVQDRVEKTQKLIAEGQNREAAEAAATARAYVENVKQELARKATEERGRGNRAVRRLEGGSASPSPAGGGRLEMSPQRNESSRDYPGGADLNNVEARLAGMDASEWNALDREPIVLAQTYATYGPGPNANITPSESAGNTGGNADFVVNNRNLPRGTFMTDATSQVRLPGPPSPGGPAGAVVGTRPEPVVPTRDRSEGGQASPFAQYEVPTGPGPFVALPEPSAASMSGVSDYAAPSAGSAVSENQSTIAENVNLILLDEDRIRDIQKYEPDAVDQARSLLQESADALANEQYVRATELALQAQSGILAAEQRAAGVSARESLSLAASRINVARASAAIVFAPAQLTEAVNLYEQALDSLDLGDNVAARQAAEQALVAADDARLYNVNKARDLAALSTRYGGHKNASPALVEANMASEAAEGLLTRPETALEGQEVAKQAVEIAQFALDRARDFTFQERLDNIYKALNTALRAGANYFNVADVKRLIAELAVARDEYCTRNFDAVELKLKDIEARLARVIETTPLVLEENLVELTDKLNALVFAGAENYMAQAVDDAKSRMNASVVSFRKHDYQSSYTNIKIAMRIVDDIEHRLQSQVYYDAVTELFAQVDAALKDFYLVHDYSPAFLKRLVSTPSGQPAALRLAGRMSPNDFRDRMTDIYIRAIHLKPPHDFDGMHSEVLLAIKTLKVCSENFQKLYIMDQLTKPMAYEVIDTAFNQLNQGKEMRAHLQYRMIDPAARAHVIVPEKIVNF